MLEMSVALNYETMIMISVYAKKTNSTIGKQKRRRNIYNRKRSIKETAVSYVCLSTDSGPERGL